MKIHKLVCMFSLVKSQGEPAGRPFIAPLFCDHMVLQRNQADPIWRRAKPAEIITEMIAGLTAKAVADTNGKWVARLTPPSAGGPYELTVSASKTVTD